MDFSRRRDIDGLKGLAIIAVILFHTGEILSRGSAGSIPWAGLVGGGFIGVDIFLVVSGYLTVSVIARQSLGTQGFRLVHFFRRRYVRLAAPLVPVVAFAVFITYYLNSNDRWFETLHEAFKALTFTSNLLFARAAGYFDVRSFEKPLLHTWYLGVTVQAYLAFGIACWIWLRLSGTKGFKGFATLLFLASATVAAIAYILGVQNSYYLPQARFFEFMAGAMAFFYPIGSNEDQGGKRGVGRITARFAAPAGLLVLALSLAMLRNWSPALAAPAVGGAFLILASRHECVLLSNAVLAIIGRLSYSLYLWHWPVLVFASILGLEDRMAAAAALVILLTLLSHFLLERPQFKSWAAFAVILAVSAGMAGWAKHERQNHCVIDDIFSYERFYTGGALQVAGPGQGVPRLLVFGDSNAMQYLGYLAQTTRFSCVTHTYDGFLMFFGGNADGKSNASEEKFMDSVRDGLAGMAGGGIAVISLYWNWTPRIMSGCRTSGNCLAPLSDDEMERDDSTVNSYFRTAGANLKKLFDAYPNVSFYILNQIPMLDGRKVENATGNYLVRNNWLRHLASNKTRAVDDSDAITPQDAKQIAYYDRKLGEIASQSANARYISFDGDLCPGGICLLMREGKPLRQDGNHFSNFGAEDAWEHIVRKINACQADGAYHLKYVPVAFKK
ncbi:MAG: acyltransferase family protein [Aeromonadales bacterium]|nr:acyltransferase family protein [Aeromonadales bacterium]MDY2890247.1 acyltransferase family protein [Succinivibrio sp.]